MPKFENSFRLIANLGKHRVIRVNRGATGTQFTIALMNGNKETSATLTADLPIRADVRVGDLLTITTEILADELPKLQ